MTAFTWNSGSDLGHKPWSNELPTDSALVFFLFAAFLEVRHSTLFGLIDLLAMGNLKRSFIAWCQPCGTRTNGTQTVGTQTSGTRTNGILTNGVQANKTLSETQTGVLIPREYQLSRHLCSSSSLLPSLQQAPGQSTLPLDAQEWI